MVNIRRDTIIKKGDVLLSEKSEERWEVKDMIGAKIYVRNSNSKSEKIMFKNDLIINHWNLILNDMGNMPLCQIIKFNMSICLILIFYFNL
jgi:hypothetical protein